MKKISIITSKKYLKSKNYESLIEILKSNDIEYEIVNIDENIDLKITNSNLILSVGGDGTALRAMKIAWLSKLPVLNIGSGRIGYLVNSLNDIDFNKIIKEAPAFSEAYNKRATTYFLMKKYDKSLMDIKVTLTLEPRHFGALSGMGLIFMNLGDFQRALVAFKAVLKIYPFSISAAANMKIIERELNLKVL